MKIKLCFALLLLLLLACSRTRAQSGIIHTICGNGTAGFSGDGGPASAAQVNMPYGIALDKHGNIYFSDQYNNRVRKIDTAGIITTVAGNGTPESPSRANGDGGAATAAELLYPTSLAIDSIGNLYIADWGAGGIRKVDTSGIITTIVRFGYDLYGLVIDRSDNVYTTTDSSVVEINTVGIVSDFAGGVGGTSGYAGDGGPATAAGLKWPWGLSFDHAGNMFIADFGNNRVRKVNTAGIITTVAGIGDSSATTGDGGPATAANFFGLTFVSIDSIGNLYISDHVGTVRKVNTAGIIYTIAGNIIGTYPGDGGLAVNARIDPEGTVMDAAGNLYVCDHINNRIRKITFQNFPPHFVHGHGASLSVCGNTSMDTLISPLAVTDTDAGQTETWSVLAAPVHGTITGTGTATSTGGTVLPAGMYYTPTGGYTGNDSFKVQVSDGLLTDSEEVHITVLAAPAGITGTLQVCAGSSTALADATTGGAWYITPATTATITTGGRVNGVAAGTATISYTISTGCTAKVVVTVNALPAAITGASSMCVGSATTLSESGGGVWSSSGSAVGIGSTGSLSCVVAGVAAGTGIVSYTLPTGCAVGRTIAVIALPPAIGGPTAVCVGQTITETETGGGMWAGTGAAISIGGTASSASCIVSGISTGTGIITYTSTATGCVAIKTVTVSTSMPAIGGTLYVCPGDSTTLTDGGLGTWSSGSGVITISGSTSSPSCVVTGVSAGTAIVTYSAGAGCSATAIITVNPLPAPIVISSGVCPGATLPLTESGTGIWSMSGSIASVGSATGMVSGISTGTAPVTYTLSATGCYRTAVVTVNAVPLAPGGPLALCVGAHSTLTESGSGTWSSGATAVATITGTTGVLTGVDTGRSIITFTSAAGCAVTTTITVSLAPTAITGPAMVCTGSTDTLNNTIGGGLWGSASTAVSVGSLSGVVTGVSTGAVVITYSLGTGCTVTRTITVAATPVAISGVGAVCSGSTTALTDATTGGTWSIAPITTGTISTGGVVRGISAGTVYVTYSSGGCSVNDTVIVNATPTAISTLTTVCQGATITATDGVSGGTWSCSGAGAVGSTGIIMGVSGGTAIVTYSIGSCSVNKTITINPIAAITGAAGLCVGNTTTLSDATTGGRWSEAGPAISIGSGTGLVTGLTSGTANITYTTTSGCTANYNVTVNTTPSAIGGTLHVCIGSTTNLSNTAGGGVWTTTSSNIGLGSASGVVTGISAGTAPVTYSLGTGCTVNTVVTVNSLPAAITGTQHVCVGLTTTLADATTGGTWSSGTTTFGTTDSHGVITGITAGVAMISYRSALGCVAATTVTVDPLPGPITGITTLCAGLTATWSDDSTGGIWSTTATAVSVGSSTGVITAIGTGTGIVNYTLPTGCTIAASVYVNAVPLPVTGATAMCIGSATTLGDGSPGGVWSATGAAATVGSATGVVNGIALGTASVSYTIGGCSAVTIVTVNSLPVAITGNNHLCVGATDTLTDAGGGVWASSNPLIAVAGSANGVVTGIIPGVASISYSLGAGCTVSMPVTVNATPASITGPSVLCAGGTVTLHDATAGGTWSSSNTSLAMAGSATSSSCVVNGISGGTVNISYTSIGTGCASVYPVAVIQVPAIMGARNLCAWGDTITVHDSLTGGSFTSTLVTVSDSGAVLSYAPGTALITYTESHGCYVTATITVNPLPGEITGSRDICVDATAALSDTSIGGIWSAAPTAAGSISTAGVVAGMSTGEVMVSYTTSRYGCSQSMTVSVDAAPTGAGAITGSSNVCAGSSITLSDATTGGTWSAAGAVAIGSLSGIVTASSAGTATISYTVSNHCGSIATTKMVTVNADVTPTISISATTDTLCAGSLAHFASVITNGGAAPVYVWSINGGPTAATGSSYSYTPANGDAVTATLTSDALCATPASVTSNTVTMVVEPQLTPTVTIEASPAGPVVVGATVMFTATVTNGGSPTYQWMLDGMAIPGATNTTYAANNFNNDDTVYCVVVSGGTCGGNSSFSNAVVMVVDNVGIQPLTPKGEVLIYPNPATSELHIEAPRGVEVSVRVLAMDGREVIANTTKTTINVGALANGIYLVQIYDTNGLLLKTTKFTKAQ